MGEGEEGGEKSLENFATCFARDLDFPTLGFLADEFRENQGGMIGDRSHVWTHI